MLVWSPMRFPTDRRLHRMRKILTLYHARTDGTIITLFVTDWRPSSPPLYYFLREHCSNRPKRMLYDILYYVVAFS